LKEILNRYILIKNYKPYQAYLAFFIILIAAYLMPLQSRSDTSLLVGVEQSFFVILSAILVVFHDSVIGYQSVSKLSTDVNKLQKKEIKDKILAYINIPEQSDNYDEFLTKVDAYKLHFTKEFERFKRKSYKLYVLFAMLGLIAVLLSLINSSNIIGQYIIDVCVYGQIFLISIWSISAMQAETQKVKMFEFVSVKNIKQNIKQYIDDKTEKEIEFKLNE
jgi:hypothetical protein